MELFDALSVLRRRKAVIIGLVLPSVLLTGLISFLIPPTYEVSRVIEIGRIGQVNEMAQMGQAGAGKQVGQAGAGHLIEERETVIARIADHRLLEDVRTKVAPEIPIERLARQIVAEKTRNPQDQHFALVRYTVQGKSADRAEAVADAVAENLIQKHTQVFEQWTALQQRYARELRTGTVVLVNEIEKMKRLFEGLQGKPGLDSQGILLLQAALNERERRLAVLKRELRDVQLNSSPPLSRNTRVVAADAMPTRPVKPKKAQNILIAAAISFVAGVSLALLMEYWERSFREREGRMAS